MDEIQMYEESLAKARAAADLKTQASKLHGLGNMYAQRGNVTKGIQCLEEALRIQLSLGDNDGAALVCEGLAGCYEIGLRDLPRAITYMEQAVRLASPGRWKDKYAAQLKAMKER